MVRTALRPSVAVLVLGAVAVGMLGPGGTAAADVTYTAAAEATGARLMAANASIPLGVAPQLTGPSARASQNSLQQSEASASFPYPGDEIATLPGIAGSAAMVPLPEYPFVVSTSFGEDIRQLSYPGLELRSESGETITAASATGGSTGAGATSRARVERAGDAVTATAGSDADAIRLGDALVISGLSATASAGRDATGELTRASSLSFSSLTAPGVAGLGFADGEFRYAAPGAQPGTPPTGTPLPAREALASLAAAGFTVSYQEPRETEDGIVGAGLEIATTLPAPPPGTPGGFTGETLLTMTLGLVRAEVAYSDAAAPAPPPAGSAPDAGPAGLPAGGPAGGGAAAPEPGSTGAGAGVLPETPPGLAVPPAAAGPPGLAAGPAPGASIDLSTLQASRAAVGSDVGWIYLMLVAVGLAAFGATAVLRYKGVR